MANVVIFCGYLSIYKTKPAGAYITANVFREFGYNTIVVDYANKLSEKQLELIVQKFVNCDTKYIGFSTTLFELSGYHSDQKMKLILELCKKSNPKITTFIGGSNIIHGYRTKIPIDYGIIGQAESALPALLRHIEYGEKIVISEETNGIKYLSDKIYGYENYNSSEYFKFTKYDIVRKNETLPLEFGRGCVFKCSYCTYDLIGKNFGDFTKTEETMYSVIMHNYENFGTTRYMLTDDTINDSIEKARLLEKVVNKLPFKFEFGGYMRLELFYRYPEMMEIYKNCGVRGVKFGIETFNKQAGLTVGKGFGEKAKDVLESLYNVWGDDVAISANFLIGLPYDTLEDLEKQTLWLENTKAVGHCSFNHLRIWKKDKNGFNTKPELLNYYIDMSPDDGSQYSNWKSPIMTYDDSYSYCQEMYERVNSKRNTFVTRYDGFSFPIILEKIPDTIISKSINRIVQTSIHQYFNNLPNTYFTELMEIEDVPNNRLTLNIPKVMPYHNVFKSKI